jgi:G3E family GTPase
MARIPIAIVTGLLGSGKTTLLNRLLRDPDMARTAVVINEFGQIGLDHALIATGGDTVVLLENGCLCCSVRGDFVTHSTTSTVGAAATKVFILIV